MKTKTLVMSLVVIFAAIVAAWWSSGPSYERYEYSFPYRVRDVKFSPSGDTLAMRVGADTLVLADVGAIGDARRIPMGQPFIRPCWSSDGASVYFNSLHEVFRCEAASGEVKTVAKVGGTIAWLSCEGPFLCALTVDKTGERYAARVYSAEAPQREPLFVREDCIGAILVSQGGKVKLALIDLEGWLILSDWVSGEETRLVQKTYRDRLTVEMQFSGDHILYRRSIWPLASHRSSDRVGRPSEIAHALVSSCCLARDHLFYFHDSTIYRVDLAARRTSVVASGLFEKHCIGAIDASEASGELWVAAADHGGKLTLFRQR